MRIIVIGDGRVGHTLAEHLCQENHDVTIIDNDEEAIQRSENNLDALCLKANGANAQALIEAGAERADIVISTTPNDETNMVCCMFAKQLGAKYTIARIRNPDYNESLMMLQDRMSIDMAINPERTTAIEISRLLRFPFASNLESFARGKVEMIEFRAQERDPFVDKALKDVPDVLPRVLYAAVERDGGIHIPSGDFIIHAGDRVHIVGAPGTITKYFRILGRGTSRVRNVMLLGGSKISYYLAKILEPMGMHINIIEIDPKSAEYLSEILPNVNIILGDGTDQELLQEEGLQQMDAFVALSDRDEENLMAGLYAARQGIRKVIVKNNRSGYGDIFSSLGLESVVSPRSITCSTILRYVRARANGNGADSIEKLYRIMGGQAEAVEFIVQETDKCINIPLKDLNIQKNVLVAVIVRKGEVIVPFGNDHLEPGDSVVIIAARSGISELSEVIRQ